MQVAQLSGKARMRQVKETETSRTKASKTRQSCFNVKEHKEGSKKGGRVGEREETR